MANARTRYPKPSLSTPRKSQQKHESQPQEVSKPKEILPPTETYSKSRETSPPTPKTNSLSLVQMTSQVAQPTYVIQSGRSHVPVYNSTYANQFDTNTQMQGVSFQVVQPMMISTPVVTHVMQRNKSFK